MNEKSNEQPENRRSHLDLPSLTFEDIERPLASFIKHLTNKYQIAMFHGTTVSALVVLVSEMCQMLLGHVSMLILQEVEPQVEAHAHTLIPEDTEGTSADSSNLLNSEPWLRGCSYCRVTKDDVEACFGDILHKSFGRLLAVVQRKTCDSVRLNSILSGEVARRVNSALSSVTGSPSVQADEFTSLAVSCEMVKNVMNILKSCTVTLMPNPLKEVVYIEQFITLPDSEDDEYYQGEYVGEESPDQNCRYGNRQYEDPNHKGCIPEVDYGEWESAVIAETVPPITVPPITVSSESSCPNDEADSSESSGFTTVCPIDETFLSLFLENLANHIAEKTHTSVPNIDLEQIITGLKEWFVEDQSYTLPQSTHKLCKSTYKGLIQRFGSKYVLLDLMVKADPSFVEFAAITLKSHLKKPIEETPKPKKKWRIFRRNNKIHPVCEDKAAESDSKENDTNGCRPSHQQGRERSCVTRFFFSIVNGLKNVFTCCTTSQSVD